MKERIKKAKEKLSGILNNEALQGRMALLIYGACCVSIYFATGNWQKGFLLLAFTAGALVEITLYRKLPVHWRDLWKTVRERKH